MRLVYSFLLYLFAPFIILYLKKRGRKNPHYNHNWSERFGLNLHNPSTKPIIWLYSVSVGETRAMAKLIELLTENYSNYQILITTMTPTGRDTAKKMYPDAIVHYVPYDLPHAVINFYKTFQPHLGLIMETEIWPNIIHYAREFDIPLFLVNARLSNKSFTSYNKINKIIVPFLNKFTAILCQDQLSLDNFKQLGFSGDIQIIGNMKFDLTLNQDFTEAVKLIKSGIPDKKIIAFASTRDGDEELILNNLPADFPHLIMIIPRHPERFILVENLLQQKNIKYQKRTTTKETLHETRVFLGDTLGEMFFYYTLSDIAVMGGSLQNHGGQNPIEPIFIQKPVIFGQSMFNFNDVAKSAISCGCALQVNGLKECFEQINDILSDTNKYQQMQQNCNKFMLQHKGASDKVYQVIQHHLQIIHNS